MRTDTLEKREDQRVPETKVRTVRVDDELWELAGVIAKRRRETLAHVLKAALVAYAESATDADREAAAEVAREREEKESRAI
jgi:hypothetical protein